MAGGFVEHTRPRITYHITNLANKLNLANWYGLLVKLTKLPNLKFIIIFIPCVQALILVVEVDFDQTKCGFVDIYKLKHINWRRPHPCMYCYRDTDDYPTVW